MKNLLLVLMFTPFLAFAQDGMPQISKALSAGDADALGAYFDENIELSILEEEGIVNKTQALRKVKRFLSSNTVSSFSEVHRGATRSSDSRYLIGILTTSSGTFRVTIYLTQNSGDLIIQEFRFDSE